jgi:large subunit ribosomal protein L9
MKVIMIHSIGGVGRQNEIKEVADGYALNFLIPNGHAVHATAERVKALQSKLATDKRFAEEKEKKVIQGIERLRGGSVRILARANDVGGLYRELTPDMVVTAIVNTYGVRVPAQAIVIREPIKKVGQHTISIVQGGHTTDVRVVVEKNG